MAEGRTWAPRLVYADHAVLPSDLMRRLLSQREPSSSPSETDQIVGYSRLANKEANSTRWSDFLFRSTDDESIETVLAKLPSRQPAQILDRLKGRMLIA